MKKIFAAIITLFTSLAIFSEDLSVNANVTKVLGYCPEVRVITKNNKGEWGAQTPAGLWNSTDTSFATVLTGFIGGQWSGVNIGQMTCVYASEQHYLQDGQQRIQQTLPILLILKTLALEPNGDEWRPLSQGVRNCISTETKNCPFHVREQPNDNDLDKVVESIKPAESGDDN